MLKLIYPFRWLISILLFFFFLSSCRSTKNAQYLQGTFDTARLSKITFQEPIIQKGDILSIVVFSDNPKATGLYNQPVLASTIESSSDNGGGASSGSVGKGYLVDQQGNIQFQSLGGLHVEGLTKTQFVHLLTDSLKAYLTNPVCQVRFLNFKISVIGEVAHPSVFAIPGEKVSLLEALGLAGDLTVFGRKENVLIIREVNGERKFARLDLTKPEVMESPFFYLQQNDVVYVEASHKKLDQADQTTQRDIGIAASIISTIALIITVLRR